MYLFAVSWFEVIYSGGEALSPGEFSKKNRTHKSMTYIVSIVIMLVVEILV